jgi:hypothetical protein
MSGSHRDSIGFTAEMLGKAKTKAHATGTTLISIFQEIDRHITSLREHGINVNSIQFDDPVIHAAWMAHQHFGDGPPMMPMDNELSHPFLSPDR